MAYRFRKHYTRDEARALLAQVREWLKQVAHLRGKVEKFEKRLRGFMLPGCDIGGESVNTWVRAMTDLDTVLREFRRRDIQIQDIDRGLVDFPAIIGGKEVLLCWEEDEEDIEFWHELDSGYAGREKL
ncbi:MAG: DUF2203 domain-containing protein [Verrucomicrobiota bacterium]